MAQDPHPLDRPVWSALNAGWAHLADGDDRAARLPAAYGLFAAARGGRDEDLAALAALVAPGQTVGLVEPEPIAPPPGLDLVSCAEVDQMICDGLNPIDPPTDWRDLGPPDAPDMLALALETRPGPFAERTQELGRFVGVRRDGRLLAMAGERMRAAPFAEISGVCVDPSARGQGLSASLSSLVAQRMIAAGEIPFLHVYPDNTPAVRVYQALGFRRRRGLVLTLMCRREGG